MLQGVALSLWHAHRSTEHLDGKAFAVVTESLHGQKLSDLAPLRGRDIHRGEIGNSAAARGSSCRLQFLADAP